MKLTIGIPTYNRPDNVLKTISELLSVPNSHKLNFLIVDNGSDINITHYFHGKLPSLTNLSIKRFETNLGFYESFYRLFDECETEYLMTLSENPSKFIFPIVSDSVVGGVGGISGVSATIPEYSISFTKLRLSIFPDT